VCITINQPDKSNHNRYATTKQHAVVIIQLNIVTYVMICPTYTDKFIRDSDIAQFFTTFCWQCTGAAITKSAGAKYDYLSQTEKPIYLVQAYIKY